MQRAQRRQRDARAMQVRSRRSARASAAPLREARNEARLIRGLRNRVYGFPNTIITKLRYSDSFTLSAGAGSVGMQKWRANSIFDPDFTGTGHQPLYRDTYATLYDQYVVLGSKITCTWIPTSATVPGIVGVVGDDDSTLNLTANTLMEQNNGKSSVLGTTGSSATTLTATFSPLLDFGVAVKDDGSSATAQGSNPTEEFYFGTWVCAADESSALACVIRVEIEYTVKFTELISPTGS